MSGKPASEAKTTKSATSAPRSEASAGISYASAGVDIEAGDLASQYQACGGNISHLARSLGLSRNTLYKRLREQGLKV